MPKNLRNLGKQFPYFVLVSRCPCSFCRDGSGTRAGTKVGEKIEKWFHRGEIIGPDHLSIQSGTGKILAYRETTSSSSYIFKPSSLIAICTARSILATKSLVRIGNSSENCWVDFWVDCSVNHESIAEWSLLKCCLLFQYWKTLTLLRIFMVAFVNGQILFHYSMNTRLSRQ